MSTPVVVSGDAELTLVNTIMVEQNGKRYNNNRLKIRVGKNKTLSTYEERERQDRKVK